MTFSAHPMPINPRINPEYILPKKLLIVDNERNLPALLDDAFNRDFLIDLAFDGPAALIKIRSQIPDALLVDVSEPDVRGYELIRFLQEEVGAENIPIIAIGNEIVDPLLEKNIRSERNVCAYFRKPFIYTELKDEIEKIITGERRTTLLVQSLVPAPAQDPMLPQLVESSAVPVYIHSVPPASQRTSAIVRSWGRWTVIAMGLGLGFIALVEGGWRLIESRHKRELFNPPLLEARWGGVPVQFPASVSWKQAEKRYVLNNVGLRGPDLEVIKRANTYRVLILGGADVFGEGVSQEEILTARLQARLRQYQQFFGIERFEVLNGGFWGLSTEEQWPFYERTLAQLRPDMVIWLWGTESALPYNGERLKRWTRFPGLIQGLFSRLHVLRPIRQRYWRGGAPVLSVNYPGLVKAARSFMAESGGILVIGAPSSIPVNFPTEPEYREVRQKYFFFSMGERPQSNSELVWTAQDHDSFAGMIEKYILLAHPEGIRAQR